jgi:hypothetical protein
VLPTTKTPKKSDLMQQKILMYGPGKIGKSTFASQAPGAIFCASEAGLNNLEVFQVTVSNWTEMLAFCKDIAEGKHEFKTVVLDTIDNLYRFCSEHVCAQQKIVHESDLEYGKGYSLVNGEFMRVLTKLSLLPYGLLLISHSQEKEKKTRTGTILRSVPTLPEGARKIVLGLVDMILFADIEVVKGEDGKEQRQRVIRTKPSELYEAGDRTGRMPETVPLDYASIIQAFDGHAVTSPKAKK